MRTVALRASFGASLSWPCSGFRALALAACCAVGAACFAAWGEPPCWPHAATSAAHAARTAKRRAFTMATKYPPAVRGELNPPTGGSVSRAAGRDKRTRKEKNDER